MEETTQRVWRLACHLRPRKSLDKKRCTGKSVSILAEKGIIKINVNIMSLDSTSIKVHPDGMGALKKVENSPLEGYMAGGTPNFIWSPRLIETP